VLECKHQAGLAQTLIVCAMFKSGLQAVPTSKTIPIPDCPCLQLRNNCFKVAGMSFVAVP
jgi:hypothetical protein